MAQAALAGARGKAEASVFGRLGEVALGGEQQQLAGRVGDRPVGRSEGGGVELVRVHTNIMNEGCHSEPTGR